MFQAVCCDDHIHCCPHDMVCNLQAQTCDSQSGGRPPHRWVEKVPALTSEGQDKQCDKQTSCPGGSTCCKKASQPWACCPLPQVSVGGALAELWVHPDSPPFRVISVPPQFTFKLGFQLQAAGWGWRWYFCLLLQHRLTKGSCFSSLSGSEVLLNIERCPNKHLFRKILSRPLSQGTGYLY